MITKSVFKRKTSLNRIHFAAELLQLRYSLLLNHGICFSDASLRLHLEVNLLLVFARLVASPTYADGQKTPVLCVLHVDGGALQSDVLFFGGEHALIHEAKVVQKLHLWRLPLEGLVFGLGVEGPLGNGVSGFDLPVRLALDLIRNGVEPLHRFLVCCCALCRLCWLLCIEVVVRNGHGIQRI